MSPGFRRRARSTARSIETTVDAPVARYYLEDYLAGRRTRPALDQALEQAFAALPEEPTQAAYQRLAERFSVDLAALHLIEVLAGRPDNARAQALFRAQLARLQALDEAGRKACVAAFDLPTVLFAPGWFYRSQPGTGADFARQRALLDRLGVDSRLIPDLENGTVEQNALIIAQLSAPVRCRLAAGHPGQRQQGRAGGRACAGRRAAAGGDQPRSRPGSTSAGC